MTALRIKGYIYPLVCMLIFLCFAVFMLMHSDNFQGAIPAGRIISALNILHNPGLLQNLEPCYPPLHIYMIALSIFLFQNISLVPRILTLIFGVCLILPYFSAVKLLTKTRVAVFATLLVIFTPDFIVQSIITMPEVPFLFFIFCSIYYFFLYEKSEFHKLKYLYFCAIFLNIAFLMRYEAAIFIFLFLILVWMRKRQDCFIFAATSSMAIMLLIVLNYMKFQAPLIFITGSNVFSSIEVNFLKEQNVYNAFFYSRVANKLFSWFKVMGSMTFPPILILGIIGLIRCLLKRRFLRNIYLFLGVYVFFAYGIIREIALIQSRYALLLLLLFYPFVVVGADMLLIFFKKQLRNFITVTAIATLIIFAIVKTYCIRPVVPTFVKKISAWFTQNLKRTDKVLMDRDKWERYYNDIIIYSKLPPENFQLVCNDMSAKGKEADKNKVLNNFKNKQIDYVFYASKGYLPEVLGLKLQQEAYEKSGYVLIRLFEYNLVYPEQGWDGRFESESFQIYKVLYKT